MVNEPNPELLTGTMLKARGWTAAMIDTFGLTPKHVKPNPYSMAASAPPMKLYLRTRVEVIEQDEAFQQCRQGSAGRRARAQQAVETKRTTALSKVEAMDIQVVVLPAGVLRKRAIQQFNRRLKAHGPLLRSPVPERFATVKSDPAVLERISVEFIIEKLSNYNANLSTMQRWVGVSEAYNLLIRNTFSVIAHGYPALRHECQRQAEAKVLNAANTSR